MNKPTVIDIFCGAGGFSEGFCQQGFEILLGVDKWEPAIKTFNHNFNLDCRIRDVLKFEDSIEEIESLPDTDIIIGSPPCVTFSSSNISGKADKTAGIRLTKIFLRIVAVKKYKSNTKLKAWFMENVANSINYLADYYTFQDLDLTQWAEAHRLCPNKKAIILKDNQPIINSADYGSPQIRKRVISGEFIKKKRLIIPERTHKAPDEAGNLPIYIALKKIKQRLPKPNSTTKDEVIIDPLYSKIRITTSDLTDHFYDTGLFEFEWKQSRFLKINHPYMGKMSFPENEDKPSRTITATKIGPSREAIIYNSEFNRKGHGEYRTPTVRESACLMGFPITYQFIGSENVKCKLVGNAVCPSVSRAFAKLVRKELGLEKINELIINSKPNLESIPNLNSYSLKNFNKLPRRRKGSRFRRHPFKDGNITVTLSNYNIEKNDKENNRWITSVQYGTGEGFPSFNYMDGFYKNIEPVVRKLDKGQEFLKVINNGYASKIGSGDELQEMFENRQSIKGLLEPTELVEKLAQFIEQLDIDNVLLEQNEHYIFKNKPKIAVKQVFALYAINKIATVANRRRLS
jgi:DNA (cytosine-5)-methyltransferase 1